MAADAKTADMAEDGRLFDRPLFNDPSARAVSRVGVVDVGSNSVRMVVFDGAARSPAYFYNEKVMAGLGKALAETGKLNPEGAKRALAALKRFALLAEGMKIAPLTVVATAAMREAEDGPAFRELVERETGLHIHVIDGSEEARLSAQGVLLGWPGAQGIVCDIGGNSMELARIGGGTVGKRMTSPLGPFRLQQVEGGPKKRREHIQKVLRRMQGELDSKNERIYLVGGSWRVIARLDMERRNYPLTVLHEYRMTPASVIDTLDWIAASDLNLLRAHTGTSAERMELLPLACEVLRELVTVFRPSEIDISSYGIREGLLYEQMPARLRARDPLIEAARAAEATQARIPGFGKKLYNFILPIFREASDERQRLIKAACLLHDTTWRAHPDYRAEACFDNATRANLGGLDHPGRVFLGLALLHRYKNSRTGSRMEPLFRLLTDEEIIEAEVLGKAMRFGAMFSTDRPEEAGSLHWSPRKKVLELKLTERGVGLMGEVAQARFNALVVALKAKPKITLA
ncbi:MULTISPECIES: Ppx/GppA family phosphatase [Gemmobacter]|jgi:exopolyphosphatase/guanosine-5'-triphosphate,3'-diphosphate pyrophosphatase|uniref:Ppx/GppA phosphatase n=2 Tax=Gemmobacter TaxID=204456 RepID=A0A2T6BC10_9RHOB|nr:MULTISPECIES: Ppx/GppA family phosphatase [Gemmobacter]PTX53584.1 Ppx/GppA phosphatase [Gemmobacter caeni]TWJ05695.1 exopolyphosphatase/guanosine-5'-triphosphate,3'-diphosphate pyrophosphatase [Gemmobacter caeni]GHC14599.1 exopolyphosphatase [Gemmobacter nanjingensis]